MADDGFNFRPVERREVKRFEPPPWEQDQFDELARQRAEQEAVEQEARARQDEAAHAAAATSTAEAATSAGAVAAGDPETVVETGADAAAELVEAEASPAKAAPEGLDEKRVSAMLAELAVEEPSGEQSYWKANVVVGAGLVVFGLVFVMWGVAGLVASRGAGFTGMLGGSVMLLFGGGFVFGGLYVAVRTLRQRGVL